MATIELFGTLACPYTQEMREWLEWRKCEFTEYDVERDEQARARLQQFTKPPYAVPILIENGKVIQVGWHGRTCPVI